MSELDKKSILERLGIGVSNSGACGIDWIPSPTGGELVSINPADGVPIASVRMASESDYDAIVEQSAEVFQRWRLLPAPQRGLIVRELGDELRARLLGFSACAIYCR